MVFVKKSVYFPCSIIDAYEIYSALFGYRMTGMARGYIWHEYWSRPLMREYICYSTALFGDFGSGECSIGDNFASSHISTGATHSRGVLFYSDTCGCLGGR